MEEEENLGVFTCTECESDQMINPYKNSWVQSGMTPPCKMCGGVVIYVDDANDRNEAVRQHNSHRFPPDASNHPSNP